jgi:putative transcription antitermination factor YqgF
MVNKSIIALDVGSRRVGVALANTVARLASPLTTIDRKTSDVWTLLGKIIDENKVDIIVIGLPRGMSGQETEQTTLVRQFAEDFKSKFNLDYIVDDNNLKHNKFSPGSKIPILHPDTLFSEEGEICVVPLAWNFFDEIKSKVLSRKSDKINFLKYFPEVVCIRQ